MCDIKEIKNLSCATKDEQIKFFGSFDCVISDLDGVIWIAYQPLSGAADCINNFKKLGKSVYYVTNNSTSSPETVSDILTKNNIPTKIEHIFTPALAFLDFLKEIEFNETLYVIGFEKLKGEFRKAGFKVAEDAAFPINEDIESIAGNIADDVKIGAVVLDVDVNLTYVKLQKAVTYLKREDCLFIAGSGDKILPFHRNGPLIGNHFFIETIKRVAGRNPRQMAKPSADYSNFIKRKLSIEDPRKVLFVGDSIEDDMRFAANSGFKKLLVLSGVTKKEDLVDWKYEEKDKPEYYVDSLKALNLILGMLQTK